MNFILKKIITRQGFFERAKLVELANLTFLKKLQFIYSFFYVRIYRFFLRKFLAKKKLPAIIKNDNILINVGMAYQPINVFSKMKNFLKKCTKKLKLKKKSLFKNAEKLA